MEHQGRAASGTESGCNVKNLKRRFNIFMFIFSYQGTRKQTVKHSVRMEYEKSWKYIYISSSSTLARQTLLKKTHYENFPQNAQGSPGSFPEAVAQWFSVKEMFLGILQDSQETS